MKHQFFFLQDTKVKKIEVLSAAILLGALRVKKYKKKKEKKEN